MKDKFKQMRLNVSLPAVISIVVGILLIVFPGESLNALGKIIGGVILLAGAAMVFTGLFGTIKSTLSIASGAIICVLGIWIFVNPHGIVSIIPIIIGVLLLLHGLQDLSMAVTCVKSHAPRCWLTFIISIITVLCGLACILNAFGVIDMAIMFAGIMLVYDGISELGIVHKVNKATKDIIDVDVVNEKDLD